MLVARAEILDVTREDAGADARLPAAWDLVVSVSPLPEDVPPSKWY